MHMYGEDSQLARFLAHTSYVQLCGFFLAFVGWCLCISAISIGQWRQWHLEKGNQYQADVMWIGIWDICHDSATPDADYYDQNCKPFGAEPVFLPKEIFLAQDLMPLCAVLATLALGFFFFAYWIIIKGEKKRGIIFTFFTIGGFLSLTTGTLILIPVTWNMRSVLNNEKIDFPESFDIPSHPKEQHVGIAIYLGLVSAVLLIVTGLLFLGNKCLLVHKRAHPWDPEKGSEYSSGKDSDYCSCCGCSLNVTTPGHYQRSCEAGQDKKKEMKSDVSFQIPMGPIPEQRVGL